MIEVDRCGGAWRSPCNPSRLHIKSEKIVSMSQRLLGAMMEEEEGIPVALDESESSFFN